MDAAFTEEQDEIRRTLRELLLKRCGPDEVKAAVRTPPGYDEHLWRQLAARLGLPGLALPAAYGGVGCGPTELALACEETGRALLPSPLLATAALAAPLILALGTERAARRTAAAPRRRRADRRRSPCRAGSSPPRSALTGAERAATGRAAAGPAASRRGPARTAAWRLYGEAGQVLDGHSARTAAGRRAHRRLRAQPHPALPRTRRRRRASSGPGRPRWTRPGRRRALELRDVPAELLGEEDGDAAAVAGALAATGAAAAAALAAEAVGAADAALARTVDHVQEREQFGRPDRLLPGGQAPARRSVRDGAGGALGGVLRGLAAGRPADRGRRAVRRRRWRWRSRRRWRRCGPWRPRRSSCTAASASPGSTRRICTSSGRPATNCCFGPVHRLRARAADAARLFADPRGTAVTV